jgi:hypothetical protein
MTGPAFDDGELAGRVARSCAILKEQGLDGLLNADGEMALVCRAMEGIGFPPSWPGGSMVTSLFPGSQRKLEVGMVFHAQSWFRNTDVVDYFISNTVMLTETGAEVLTDQTPETLIVKG